MVAPHQRQALRESKQRHFWEGRREQSAALTACSLSCRDYVTSLDSTGTFAWAAPELLLGRRCTERVDIYSFGALPLRCTHSNSFDNYFLHDFLKSRSNTFNQKQADKTSLSAYTVRFTYTVNFFSGVVLWEIVTGERPMRGQTRALRCSSMGFTSYVCLEAVFGMTLAICSSGRNPG